MGSAVPRPSIRSPLRPTLDANQLSSLAWQCTGVAPCTECERRHIACKIDPSLNQRYRGISKDEIKSLDPFPWLLQGLLRCLQSLKGQELRHILELIAASASFAELAAAVAHALLRHHGEQPAQTPMMAHSMGTSFSDARAGDRHNKTWSLPSTDTDDVTIAQTLLSLVDGAEWRDDPPLHNRCIGGSARLLAEGVGLDSVATWLREVGSGVTGDGPHRLGMNTMAMSGRQPSGTSFGIGQVPTHPLMLPTGAPQSRSLQTPWPLPTYATEINFAATPQPFVGINGYDTYHVQPSTAHPSYPHPRSMTGQVASTCYSPGVPTSTTSHSINRPTTESSQPASQWITSSPPYTTSGQYADPSHLNFRYK